MPATLTFQAIQGYQAPNKTRNLRGAAEYTGDARPQSQAWSAPTKAVCLRDGCKMHSRDRRHGPLLEKRPCLRHERELQDCDYGHNPLLH